MKKLFVIIFVFISFNAFAVEEKTTFSLEIFNEAQKNGKIVVINSWNKSCGTCAVQIKILQEAKEEFKDILFLSYEQTANENIAKLLDIDFWTTIVVYKNNKEVARSIGQTNKSKIYSIIKKNI